MAGHVTDFSKSPDQIVLDLINFDNNTSLTLGDIAFGIPTTATGENPPANTQLEVFGQVDAGYKSAVVVFYERLQISNFVQDGRLVIPVGSATLYRHVIAAANMALGINLVPGEYIDGDIGDWTGAVNETKDIDIQMSPNGKVFVGSLPITLLAEEIPMSLAFPNGSLLGFQPVT